MKKVYCKNCVHHNFHGGCEEEYTMRESPVNGWVKDIHTKECLIKNEDLNCSKFQSRTLLFRIINNLLG